MMAPGHLAPDLARHRFADERQHTGDAAHARVHEEALGLAQLAGLDAIADLADHRPESAPPTHTHRAVIGRAATTTAGKALAEGPSTSECACASPSRSSCSRRRYSARNASLCGNKYWAARSGVASFGNSPSLLSTAAASNSLTNASPARPSSTVALIRVPGKAQDQHMPTHTAPARSTPGKRRRASRTRAQYSSLDRARRLVVSVQFSETSAHTL